MSCLGFSDIATVGLCEHLHWIPYIPFIAIKKCSHIYTAWTTFKGPFTQYNCKKTVSHVSTPIDINTIHYDMEVIHSCIRCCTVWTESKGHFTKKQQQQQTKLHNWLCVVNLICWCYCSVWRCDVTKAPRIGVCKILSLWLIICNVIHSKITS